ncbi:hypothetical protein Bbelb_017340 [Branchiostoma belcheri]|nr:hypothetical protein Bbelb_017340 [Branchiostoma belcheri]
MIVRISDRVPTSVHLRLHQVSCRDGPLSGITYAGALHGSKRDHPYTIISRLPAKDLIHVKLPALGAAMHPKRLFEAIPVARSGPISRPGFSANNIWLLPVS